jgi:alpha-methylacyl-CoA racemase
VSDPRPTGPLQGVRVLEVGGIGPNPFAGMLLADLGADVIRLDRTGAWVPTAAAADPTLRGRTTIAVDLKSDSGRELALGLADRAAILIEGYRPGVMERLGLGPDALLARNPALVYGRMTGYGQTGPLASVPGHDINYLSVAGILGASRRTGERPLFALNLVGDYGGGAMFLALGVVSALHHAQRTGEGQVVDTAMVDGASLLTTLTYAMSAVGEWDLARPGSNLLDSGAPFYEVYACADGRHLALGALEPQFYARLLELLEIDPAEMPQFDRERWPEFKQRFAALFATRPAAEWGELLEAEPTCATVVREPSEIMRDPHMAARDALIELDGVLQPAPAPRFSATPATARPGQTDAAAALARWGVRDGGEMAR